MSPPHKKREGAEGGSSTPRPLNTTTICLDGKRGRALQSYRRGIAAILEWCEDRGLVRDVPGILGPNRKVFTTPPTGTFHVVLKYGGRSLQLLIAARDLYLVGWRGPNGSYEIESDTQTENYMRGSDVQTVKVRRNYNYIAPDGKVEKTRIGFWVFRETFDTLYDYKGGSPALVEEAVGIIAVFICEATRLQGPFKVVCSSFMHNRVSRLSQMKSDHRWINRYGYYCRQGMMQIDRRLSREAPKPIENRDLKVQSLEDIVGEIRVFNIDAYNMGKFKHDPRPDVVSEAPMDITEEAEGSNRNMGKRKQSPNKSARENRRFLKRGSKEVDGHLSRRGYSTAPHPVSTHHVPLSLVDWRNHVPQSIQAQNILSSGHRSYISTSSSLRHLADQVSGYMAHFPALRTLCSLNYQKRNQINQRKLNRTAGPRKTFLLLKNTTIGAQISSNSSPDLQYNMKKRSNTQLQSLWSSILSPASQQRIHSRPTARQQSMQPVVKQAALAARHLKTKFGPQETDSRLIQKPPFHRGAALLSRFLQLLHR